MRVLNIKIAKLNETREIEFDLLPEVSQAYAAEYGITQRLNDTHASIRRKDFETEAEFLDAVRAKVDRAHDQLENGTVPGTRVPDAASATTRMISRKLAAVNMQNISEAEFERLLAGYVPATAEAA